MPSLSLFGENTKLDCWSSRCTLSDSDTLEALIGVPLCLYILKLVAFDKVPGCHLYISGILVSFVSTTIAGADFSFLKAGLGGNPPFALSLWASFSILAFNALSLAVARFSEDCYNKSVSINMVVLIEVVIV